jgi:hypothetical protein
MGKLFAVVCALCLSACDYMTEKNVASAPPPAAQVVVPSFSEVATRVFEPKCVRCHGHYGEYASVLQDIDEINEHAILTRQMPKEPETPLTKDQFDLLKNWIDHGAPEEATSS